MKLIAACSLAAFLLLPATVHGAPRIPATRHPDPEPISKVRAGHPRLFFTTDNVYLLRERWDDPVFESLREGLEGWAQEGGTEGAVGNAIKYLATGDETCARRAAALAGAQPNWSSFWLEPEALVFDWCYEALAPEQRAAFVESLNGKIPEAEGRAVAKLRFHESYYYLCWRYPSICLAIHGQPGADSRLGNCHNWMLHYREATDETMGDGGARDGYQYQHFFQVSLLMMWSLATDRDLVAESGYARGITEYFARRLLRDGLRITAGPEDHSVDGDGCAHGSPFGAYSLYFLAQHFDDPLAQWLGDRAREQAEHFGGSGGRLGWPAFVTYHPSRRAASPAELDLALALVKQRVERTCSAFSEDGTGAGFDAPAPLQAYRAAELRPRRYSRHQVGTTPRASGPQDTLRLAPQVSGLLCNPTPLRTAAMALTGASCRNQ